MNTTISAIYGICSNFDKIDCSFNLTEAVMNHNAYKNSVALEKINKISSKLLIGDAISFLGTTVSFSVLLDRKFDIISIAEKFPDPFFLGFIALSLVFSATIYLAVKKLNKLTNPNEFITEENIKVRWGRPENEKVKQGLLLSRAVMNIGILCLSPLNPFVAASLGFQAYNLMKVTQLKWFKFSCKTESPFRNAPVIGNITFKYLLPRFTTSNQPECTICFDEKPDTLFCARHSFHLNCVPGWMKAKVDALISSINITNRKDTPTRHYVSGVYTHTTYNVVYEAKLPIEKLPNCPNCREAPTTGNLTAKIWDRKRMQHANVILNYV